MVETIVGGIIVAVIVVAIVTNPAGDSAVLSGLNTLSTGTIGAIGKV